MGESKSFIVYIFLFIFIGYMYVTYIGPNTGNKLITCTKDVSLEGAPTNYKVKIDFIDGEFNRADLKVAMDLNNYWNKKDEYEEKLEDNLSSFRDMGFIYEVFFDNKTLLAELEVTNEKISKDKVYFNRVSDVKSQYENDGYTCEVE